MMVDQQVARGWNVARRVQHNLHAGGMTRAECSRVCMQALPDIHVFYRCSLMSGDTMGGAFASSGTRACEEKGFLKKRHVEKSLYDR